jgi:hypothetical protein
MRECGGGLQLAYITDNFVEPGRKKKEKRERQRE